MQLAMSTPRLAWIADPARAERGNRPSCPVLRQLDGKRIRRVCRGFGARASIENKGKRVGSHPAEQACSAPQPEDERPRRFVLCRRRHGLAFFRNGSAQHANHVAHAEDADQGMFVKNRKMTNGMLIHFLDDIRQIVIGPA